MIGGACPRPWPALDGARVKAVFRDETTRAIAATRPLSEGPLRGRTQRSRRLPRRRADALDARLADALPARWSPRPTAPRSPISTAISLADFCLGDTGSMFGHSPPPVARGDRGAGRARPDLHAAERRRGRRRHAAAASASACRTGRSRRPRPTPTASPCASPAPSPAATRSSSSTAAITARSTRPSCA